MKELAFQAAYGDESRTVEIEQVSGANGSHYLFINRFYHGSFHMEDGEWILSVHIPNRTPEKAMVIEALRPSLQTADIEILVEIFKSNV